MLWNASVVKGYAIAASDGRLGTVSDFLFDDSSWLVRWLVVDTGKWLSGRRVLLPPSVLGHLDSKGRELAVKLTRQEIKDSPDIDTDRPVTRQMESNVYDYYGWSPYWSTSLFMGGYGYIGGAELGSSDLISRPSEKHFSETQRYEGDLHLRSVAAVTGYHIHASDGEIGHVDDFLVQDADWSIHYLVVDTKNWWPGKKVLISPRSAREINWSAKLVNLNVDHQSVKDSPAYDASTTVDRAYEARFHDHYGAFRREDEMEMPNSIIAVFANHLAADTALKKLSVAGFEIKNLSVVGKGYHTEEKVVGFYNMGDRIKFWGTRGAFWGGFWGLFLGGIFMTVPLVGHVIVLGYLATIVISTVESAIMVGGMSALGAALYSIGIPKDSVIRYETAVKEDNFLVTARGTAEEIARAQVILGTLSPSQLDVHAGTKTRHPADYLVSAGS